MTEVLNPAAPGDQVRAWSQARTQLGDTLAEVENLESTRAVSAFHHEMDLLERRLVAQPEVFRDMFISDGVFAAAKEFREPELSKEFTLRLWDALLRGDAASTVLMRFLWNLPVGRKRRFIIALDKYLSDRYPMFKGMSDSWPASNGIEPYIRPPEERCQDFDLVNTGYLGYMSLGYTLREVELFVWLEAIRDKQCAEKPCELGQMLGEGQPPKGGCPVQIHIPTMFEYIGEGRWDEALSMLEACNPLPDVTGRVCPQELQCQGVCLHKRPMSIGQLEWFLPQREKLVHPTSVEDRYGGREDPWKVAAKPPVAIVGSG
ncbi:MAG: hypothetical protein LBM66_02390, partial [Bifidobacteriaceae bacterium]|nr:hypothetical protein [Bifidobacteriaceae bacterium]